MSTTVQTPGTLQFFTFNGTGLVCSNSWCYGNEPSTATTWTIVCDPDFVVATQGSLTSCSRFVAKSGNQCLTNYGDGELRILDCPAGLTKRTYPAQVQWSLQTDGSNGNAGYNVISPKPGVGGGTCMLTSGFIGVCGNGPTWTNQWNAKGSAMTPLPPIAPPLSSQTIGIIVGVVCGVVALIAIACLVMWFKRRKARGGFDPKDKELPTIEGLESKAQDGTPRPAPKPALEPVPTRSDGYNSVPLTPAAAKGGNPALYDSFVPPARSAGPGGSAPPVVEVADYNAVTNVQDIPTLTVDPGVIPKRQASTRSPASYAVDQQTSIGPGTVVGNTVVALTSPAEQTPVTTIQLGQTYVAKLTYYQTLSDEITVLAGEKLIVKELWDDGWMNAQSLTSGKTGMVPASVITGEQAQ